MIRHIVEEVLEELNRSNLGAKKEESQMTQVSTPVKPVSTSKPAPPAPAPKVAKVRRQTIIRLTDASGAILKIVLRLRKDGKSATTWIVYTTKTADGKKTHTKGATQEHANVLDASKVVDSLVASALKLNWVRREARNAPDAFTSSSIPAASVKA